MSNKGSMVSKAEVSDKLLVFVWSSNQRLNRLLSKMVSDIDSIPIIKIFCGLFEHHVDALCEETWCQHTTLFHTNDDQKGLREVNVVSDLAMQLEDQFQVHWRTVESFHDLPHSSSAHCRMLSSDQQMLYTTPCFAFGISLGAARK